MKEKKRCKESREKRAEKINIHQEPQKKKDQPEGIDLPLWGAY